MSAELPILMFGFIVGFYMAWNIGANDVANAMSAAVGTGAITLRQAVFIAGIFNMLGAAFIGSHVTDTIRNGIVSPDMLADPHLALIGALSALLSAALWVTFATWKSLPVSTTHSIVGAMVGFGIVAGGFRVVNWGGVCVIALGWVASPVFSLMIGFLTFRCIVRFILNRSQPYEMALTLSPMVVGTAVFVCAMSFLFRSPLGKSVEISTVAAISASLAVSVALGFGGKQAIARLLRSKAETDPESVFRRIQIGTACYMALAQGANDVANAIGPLALIYFLVKTGTVGAAVPVPLFLLLFGGVGIACGIVTGGSRAIQLIGEKIATLNNTRGFAVDFSAATTVLIASKMGLPVSTTHAAIGGVMGVGLAGGIEAVNVRGLFQMVLYCMLTLPVAAFTCMAIFQFLMFLI